jgi:protoheme IX farnesyltransferase
MARTADRPLATGTLRPMQVLAFAIALGVASMAILLLLVNAITAVLTFASLIGYAFVYTGFLKRATPQNIVIGGIAGAAPPLLGWAAVTGMQNPRDWEYALLLVLVIFVWTPPHFWALALFKSDDYERAGIPMMPNVAGEASTRRQIFAYALVVAVVGVLPWLLGYTSAGYGIVAAALGAGFVWYSWKVLLMPDGDRLMRPAKVLFAYSLLYLFGIFAAYLADSMFGKIFSMGVA